MLKNAKIPKLPQGATGISNGVPTKVSPAGDTLYYDKSRKKGEEWSPMTPTARTESAKKMPSNTGWRVAENAADITAGFGFGSDRNNWSNWALGGGSLLAGLAVPATWPGRAAQAARAAQAVQKGTQAAGKITPAMRALGLGKVVGTDMAVGAGMAGAGRAVEGMCGPQPAQAANPQYGDFVDGTATDQSAVWGGVGNGLLRWKGDSAEAAKDNDLMEKQFTDWMGTPDGKAAVDSQLESMWNGSRERLMAERQALTEARQQLTPQGGPAPTDAVIRNSSEYKSHLAKRRDSFDTLNRPTAQLNARGIFRNPNRFFGLRKIGPHLWRHGGSIIRGGVAGYLGGVGMDYTMDRVGNYLKDNDSDNVPPYATTNGVQEKSTTTPSLNWDANSVGTR